MSKFSEDLFQSIDTIIQQRIENLPYDRTIVCKIKSLDSKKIGKYTVLYQDTELIAYSESMDYKPDEEVYVSVQQGDFSKKKMITGRVIEEISEKIDIRPFENFISLRSVYTNESLSTLIINNNKVKTIKVGEWETNPSQEQIIGYDSLGIKFTISANLKNTIYKVVNGTYDLTLDVEYIDQRTGKKVLDSNNFYINLNDMIFIDPYYTFGFCNQEKVFDIKDKIITKISLYFNQYSNFYSTSADGMVLVPPEENLQIQIKNIKIEAGYDATGLEDEVYKLYLFSNTSYLYNKTSNQKNLYLRILGKDANARWVDMSNIGQKNFGIFNSFNTNYSDKYGELSFEDIEPANSDKFSPQKLNIILDSSRNIEKSTFKASILLYDGKSHYYYSNTISFYNNDFINNIDIIDLMSGLTFVTSEEEQKGVFNDYGQDKQLLNTALKNKVFNLILKFSEDGLSLADADSITYYIPKDNSMLQIADTKYNTDKHIINNVEYYGFVRKITTDPLNTTDLQYREIDKTVLIPFKIKDLYNQSYINNIIYCSCSINNKTYDTSKEILFGVSGSYGADFILKLKLLTDKDNDLSEIPAIWPSSGPGLDTFYVKPHLYNYTMEEQDLSGYTIKYSFRGNSYITKPEDNNIFSFDNNIIMNNNNLGNYKNYYITASLEIEGKSIKAYLPIAITKNSDQFSYIAGCSTIVYDITGKKPYYYTNPYKLYDKNNQIVDDVAWVKFEESDESDDNTKIFFDNENNIIIPPNIYNPEYKSDLIYAKKNGEICWIQPICIIYNRYPSVMWNGEGNQITLKSDASITKDNQFLESNVVGQLNNKKTGLFIGSVVTNDGSPEFGLFKYENGICSLKITDKITSINAQSADSAERADTATSAETASKLGTMSIGSQNTPVYFNEGVPVACSGTLSLKVISAGTADNCSANGALDLRIKELEQKVNQLLENMS